MAKRQPSYTKEFKREAVRLVETSTKNKAEIARDLGISDSALSKWCKEFANHGEQALEGERASDRTRGESKAITKRS